jgi:hypothetical protein
MTCEFWRDKVNSTSTESCVDIHAGMAYQGGVIFYTDGVHGLITTLSDIPSYTQRWNTPSLTYAGTDIVVGSGQANTSAIVAYQGTGSMYAARLCDELTEDGYSDWYLPSKDELNLLYIAFQTVTMEVAVSWNPSYYWSSSDEGDPFPWLQNFSDGTQGGDAKNAIHGVRAIRSF